MWPDGMRAAAAFTFDFDAEEVWIGEDGENADRPGVLSQGTYGAKVAVPQILALLRAHDLRATFFIPGRVAERHPERVREIMADGHEIGHHGYTHTSPANLDAAAEQDELTHALEVLRGFGADVAGYRSPSWDFSPRTLDLLEQHGFSYSSNLMDDIRPYRHPGKRLAELPIQWILDDAAHFWFDGRESWTRRISTPSEVREIWEAEFEGIRRLGGAFVLTMHPQVIGRPGRLPLLDGMITHVLGQTDVWVATCRELAERVGG
jgi:peptidoglycan/xylan/chitin deacetylase (PgdA/CDA1 family)